MPEPSKPPHDAWGACPECGGLDGKHGNGCTGAR